MAAVDSVHPRGRAGRYVRLAAFLSAALLTAACNREPQAPKGTGVAQRSVNASAPVFRNLGKRGESGL